MIRRKPKIHKPKAKKRKAILPYMHVVDIVADGTLADSRQAGGLQVPVLVLDTSQRPDINDVLLAHSYEHLDNGDVETIWTQSDANWIGLDVQFKRPVETRAIIRFPLPKYAMLIHLTLTAQSLRIHPGQPGSKFSDFYFPVESDDRAVESTSESLFLDVPRGGFEIIWNDMYRSHLVKYFKNTRKCSDAKARELAEEAFSNIDTMSNFRLPRNSAETGRMLYLKSADLTQAPDDADQLS